MAQDSTRNDELASNIDKARKQVTILFTDIVDSSRYWDMFGDVEGRLMVDRHNRLVFPVIRKYRGRVVKTIGDGIMAAFKRPNDALNAAIGIQQILQKMRMADRSFHAKVRIGLHTGMAIIEAHDVYGDAVNLAKRVESFGDANEIYLSEATVEFLDDIKHALHKKGSFLPKGKREPVTVYRCRWNEYKDLSRGLKVSSDLPLDPREKGDIVGYLVILLFVITALYQIYGRYIVADMIADSPAERLLALNPMLVFHEYPTLFPCLVAILLGGVLLLMWIKTAPYIFLRTLKGFMGMGLGFALVYMPVYYFKMDFATGQGQEIYKTALRFTRLEYPAYKVRAHDLDGYPRDKPNLYDFFEKDLIVPVERQRVQLSRQADERPAIAGVWTADNLDTAIPQPFYFRFFDLLAVAMGVLGFVSGFMNFNIRPS
ncbi:MAG TPA: adenylate/guanylate cyclase domain-containing protein [Gammaproteobacteria bacterium]